MNESDYMDDSTFYKYVIGILTLAWSLLIGWTHHRASSAHTKIDSERKDNEARFNLVYEKIAESIQKTEKCRIEIKKDLEVRMTEPHIKEYVAMSIKPLENKVDATHTDIKAILNLLSNK